jgi:hypothetical protein
VNRKQRTKASSMHTVRERENQRDAFAALALMRRQGLPASEAVKVEGTTLANLEKYVGPALKKRGDDYVAKPSDDFVRRMLVPDPRGLRHEEIRGSKAASLVGKYWNALDEALKGNPAALKQFRGKTIPGTDLGFLTDKKSIERLQDAGQLENIREIYWHGRRR